MSATIFLLSADGALDRMEETEYESEDLLQRLLAEHPDLLAGDQIDDRQSRRWLLIEREMGVADTEGGSSRWSLDHLFLDQEAVPTLVEVKRSSDTRLRREVVGQMLDYAANGVRHWPIAEIRRVFEARCERRSEDPERVLARFLRSDESGESFWKQAADNLALGRLRLLFVADVIPGELQRVVEFLNEQMVRTEVLAIEVRQFAGESGSTTLVPRVIGKTTAAQDIKDPSGGPREDPWDTESFLSKLKSEQREKDIPIARQLIDWATDRGLIWQGGRGRTKANIYATLDANRSPISLYEGTGRCILHIQFSSMGPAYDEVEPRRPIAEFFNVIPGVELDPERPFPGIRFDRLDSVTVQEKALRALDAMLEQLGSSGELEANPRRTE